MNRKAPLGLSLLMSVCILAGCDDRPKNIMSESETVSVLTDMRIAQAMFETGQGYEYGFSSTEEAQRGVLAQHGISEEKYRQTLEWYGENMDEYYKLWKDVDKRLNKKIAKVDPDAVKETNDENNIWPYPDHLIFFPDMLSDGLTFSITDPDFEKGGYAELKLITEDTRTVLNVLMGVDYDNGETSYISRMPSEFREVKLRLQSDTASRVKRLFGYIRPNEKLSKTLTLDSITLIKMPYDSTEYFRITSQIKLKRR